VAEHLTVLFRTEHNVGEKHCRTLKPVTPVSGGLLTVGWCWLPGNFHTEKSKPSSSPSLQAVNHPGSCFWHLVCALLSFLYFGGERAVRLLHEQCWEESDFSFCFVWQCQKSQLDLAVSYLVCFGFCPCRIQHHFVLPTSYVMPSHFSSWLSALTQISKLMAFSFSLFLCR